MPKRKKPIDHKLQTNPINGVKSYVPTFLVSPAADPVDRSRFVKASVALGFVYTPGAAPTARTYDEYDPKSSPTYKQDKANYLRKKKLKEHVKSANGSRGEFIGQVVLLFFFLFCVLYACSGGM